MEKRFRHGNLLVLLVIVLAIAAAGLIAAKDSGKVDTDRPVIGTLAADATDAPAETAAPTDVPAETAEPTAAPADAEEPAAKAYLIVYVGTGMYDPIPLLGSARFTLKTGGERVNIIEVNEESVWMAESTCPTQDCVNQGVVSLDNKDTRILGDCIYCMAHNVTLQLIDAQQYAEMMEVLADE